MCAKSAKGEAGVPPRQTESLPAKAGQAEASCGPSETQGEATKNLPAALERVAKDSGIDPEELPRDQALAIAVKYSMTKGSMPPPEMLADYDQALPGLAQKIVDWAEEDRNDQKELEKRRLRGAEKRADRGQLIAGAVALSAVIAGSIVATVTPLGGALIVAVGVGGPVTATVLARFSGRSKKKSDD